MRVIFAITILLIYYSLCALSIGTHDPFSAKLKISYKSKKTETQAICLPKLLDKHLLYLIGGNIDSKYATLHRICKTTGCIKAAQLLMGKIDTTVNPCDNFYQFACGEYIKKNALSTSIFDDAANKVQKEIKESIENKIVDDDPRTLKLLKSHYNSCLDTENIERGNIKMLLNIFDKLGGWPILVGESWDEATFDWKNLIYRLRRMGYEKSVDSIIRLEIYTNRENNTFCEITLGPPESSLRQYLVKGSNERRIYNEYLMKIAEILGVDLQRAKKDLYHIASFEKVLAKITSLGKERENQSWRMSIAELQSIYPGIPWKDYLNELLRPHYVIESTESVIIKNLNYFKSLMELLSKVDKRTLANYIIWHVIDESTHYLNRQVRLAKAQALSYNADGYPRWVECINHLKSYVPAAVGALYIRKAFDTNLKNSAEELVEDLRKSFKNSLEKADWMDKKTKTTALKKLKMMAAHIAYPDELLNDDKLHGYYRNIKAVPENYLDSYLSLGLFNLENFYRRLSRPFNKTNWVSHGNVAVANANYEPEENSINIPAGYFTEDLFMVDRPNYMNYGGMGHVIGHELTHAFDTIGNRYNEEGNLVKWWDHKTKKEYTRRIQCIVDQYSNYTVRGVDMKINGTQTLGENIADNGGIKQAYYSYQEYERRNGPEPRLPVIAYTPRQLFWISVAGTYCQKYSPETIKNNLIYGTHSPGEFRVIGSFSNIPEFASDFECPLGSTMNPVKKCSVW